MSDRHLHFSDDRKPWVAEVTSSSSRGRWLSLQNSFYFVGQIIASGIAVPFGRGKTDWSWRVPLLIQLAPALINVAFVMFLPESPRWLFARGRKAEAARILAKYHSRDQDVNSPVVKLEMEELNDVVTVSSRDRRWWDFAQVFAGKINVPPGRQISWWNVSQQLKMRPNCYRFALCAIVSVWGQLSGNGLLSYFFPVILQQANIKDSNQQRNLLLVNSCISFVGAMTGSAVVDHLGRRSLMLFSSTVAILGMGIVGGVLSTPSGSDTIPEPRAKAGVAFLSEFLASAIADGSAIYGLFLFWLDSSARPVPDRSSSLRESCQRSLASRPPQQCSGTHQHLGPATMSPRHRIQDLFHFLWLRRPWSHSGLLACRGDKAAHSRRSHLCL